MVRLTAGLMRLTRESNKMPTNRNIINFVLNYGISLVLVVALIWGTYGYLVSIMPPSPDSRAVGCAIDELEAGALATFKGEQLIVTERNDFRRVGGGVWVKLQGAGSNYK